MWFGRRYGDEYLRGWVQIETGGHRSMLHIQFLGSPVFRHGTIPYQTNVEAEKRKLGVDDTGQVLLGDGMLFTC